MYKPELISFYIQVRNYLFGCEINDFNDVVTSENMHLHFFNELEQHEYDNTTRLEILLSLLEESGIFLEKDNGKFKKNHSNFSKILDFLKVKEEEYRDELLRINLLDYFINNRIIDEMSMLNYEAIIEEANKNIKNYNKITLFYYEEELTTDESIKLVSDFFDFTDKNGRLSSKFKQFLINKNVFIWNDEDKEKQELLKNSNFGKTCWYYGFYNNYVTQINDELYVNVHLVGDLSDCYSIIHEFIHYYIICEQVSEEESECLNFFSEFPSIFFEYLFNLYLEENELYAEERSIQIEERKVENIKNVFMSSAFYKNYQHYLQTESIDFDNFYNSFSKSLEFENFEDKALDVYYFLKEDIYNSETFCDLINLNLSEIEFYNLIIYISATLFSEELIKKIRNGKNYLIERMLNITKSLSYNDMDPTYILEYLELKYRFYSFKATSERVVPKRLEKLRQ